MTMVGRRRRPAYVPYFTAMPMPRWKGQRFVGNTGAGATGVATGGMSSTGCSAHCGARQIHVRWADGTLTKVCERRLQPINDHWQVTDHTEAAG